MSPDEMRELAAAIDSPGHLSDAIGSPLASGEIVTTADAGDALNYAAGEIERLRKNVATMREGVATMRAENVRLMEVTRWVER